MTPNEPDWQPGFEGADTSVQACVPFYGVYDLTGAPATSGAYGPGLVELLEKRVFKTAIDDDRERFEQASPSYRVNPRPRPCSCSTG